ncbi:MAG: serine/threonine protein phosphatase [Bacteroidetes bacterium]|nr:serine/threonine protein phosphatase [Bacteroidota bacterium]
MAEWVIPDIHGCYRSLEALLTQIDPGKDDTVYFLGDYIDRGRGSREVIDTIMLLRNSGVQVRTLRGNHEEFFLIARKAGMELKKGFFRKRNRALSQWFQLGGKEMLQSFKVNSVLEVPDRYVEWMSQLEYFIELPHYFLVHAGFNFKADDIFADTNAMMTLREFEIVPEKVKGKKIIHGHVPVGLDLIHQTINTNFYGFIDLDNGCVYAGREGMGNLLAFEIGTKKLLVQQNVE